MSARLSVVDFITGIDVDFAGVSGDFSSPSLTIPIVPNDAVDAQFQPLAVGQGYDALAAGAEAFEEAVSGIADITQHNEFLYDKEDAPPRADEGGDDEDVSLGSYTDLVFSDSLIHRGLVVPYYFDNGDRFEVGIAQPTHPDDLEALAEMVPSVAAKRVNYLRGVLWNGGVEGYAYGVEYGGEAQAEFYVEIKRPEAPVPITDDVDEASTTISDVDLVQRLFLEMSVEHVLRLLRESGLVTRLPAGEKPLEEMTPMDLAFFLACYYLATCDEKGQQVQVQCNPRPVQVSGGQIYNEGTGTFVTESVDPVANTQGTYLIKPKGPISTEEGLVIIIEWHHLSLRQTVLASSPTGFVPAYLRLAQAIKAESNPQTHVDESADEGFNPDIYWSWYLRQWVNVARTEQPRCPRRLLFGLRGNFSPDLPPNACRDPKELRAWLYTQLVALVAKGELPRETARVLLSNIADIVREDSGQTDHPALSAALHTLLEQVGPAH